MARQGSTWRAYQRLVEAVGAMQGETIEVMPDGNATREASLLKGFTKALGKRHYNARANDVLRELGIEEKYYRTHLRYIAVWDQERRRLLAGGASPRLLESLQKEAEAGQLVDLNLSGTVTNQRRQLAQHLHNQAATSTPDGLGWLKPSPSSSPSVSKRARVFDGQRIWVYNAREIAAPDSLHPSVARSLIARYVPLPGGVVADPMAGAGTVPLAAAQLGHWAWASDSAPRLPWIAPFDLQEVDLLDATEGQAADLVVLHPPTLQELGLYPKQYDHWLDTALRHAWTGVRIGGYLALITGYEEAPRVLERTSRGFTASWLSAFPNAKRKRDHELYHHLTVARDGSQAWHIFVLRSPEDEVTEQEPKQEKDTFSG